MNYVAKWEIKFMSFTFIMVVPEVLPLWLDVLYAGDIHVPVIRTRSITRYGRCLGSRYLVEMSGWSHKELRGLLNQTYLLR